MAAQENEVWACEFERTALFNWSDGAWNIDTDWFTGITKVEIDYSASTARITRGSIGEDWDCEIYNNLLRGGPVVDCVRKATSPFDVFTLRVESGKAVRSDRYGALASGESRSAMMQLLQCTKF